MAHAPNPMGVICRSELPSCLVSMIVVSVFRSKLSGTLPADTQPGALTFPQKCRIIEPQCVERRFTFSVAVPIANDSGEPALLLQEAVLGRFNPGAEPGQEDPGADKGGHQQRDGQDDEVDGHERLLSSNRGRGLVQRANVECEQTALRGVQSLSPGRHGCSGHARL